MADNSAKAMDSYQSARRLVLAVAIVAIFGVLVFGQSAHDDVLHDRLEIYGVLLILIGIVGRLWSILYIGSRKSSEVVSTGPYSVTRNPLYFFSSIAAAGVGAQMGSFAAAIGFAILCAAAFYVVIIREERYLLAKLGAPYQAYLDSVPRFWPNPFIFKDQAEVTFKTRAMNQTLLDGLVFFLSIPFFELVEEGQDFGIIPVLFHLF